MCSTLILLNYLVDKINFELNESYVFKPDCPINLNQNIERKITKIDDNRVKISLLFDIYNTEEKEVPFTLSISVSGIFELEDWESDKNKEIATVNTAAILFPFLRSLISTITANVNVPPYVLPVFDVNSLFE